MIPFSLKLLKYQKSLFLRSSFRSLSTQYIMNSLNTSTKELRIQIPNGHLAVKVWNEKGKKTPILALHGWMDNAGTWDNLCPLLDEGYPIYALDFLGHGYSSHPLLGMGIYFTDHLVTINRVINYFKWEQVILLGHSMGGGVSSLYSGTMPHLVEKLIVIDLFRSTTVEATNQPELTADSIQQLLSLEEIKTEPPKYTYEEIVDKLIRSYGQSLNEDAAKTLLIRNSQRHNDGKYSFTYSPILKTRGTLSLTFEQQKAFLSNITCDMLMIKAVSSSIFGTKENAKEVLNSYKRTSRNFVFEVIEGTHHLHMINPVPVADVINKFLHGVPQSEASKAKSKDYISSQL